MYLNIHLEDTFTENWDGDYNSSIGRFVSEDPLGFGGGQNNLFRYAFNNPLKFIDHNGMDAVIITGTTANGFPHVIIGIDQPNGQRVYFSFGPENSIDKSSTGSVKGEVSYSVNPSDFLVQMTGEKVVKSTPDEDLAMIQLGLNMKTAAENEDFLYQLYNMTGENDASNCAGFALGICKTIVKEKTECSIP